MLWGIDDLLDRSGFDDLPVQHDDNLPTHLPNHGQVMTHEQRRATLQLGAQQVEDLQQYEDFGE